ncbi:putative nucleocapsid protein [White bream virus]|uniref:Nucleoprotein n=1 Tax=White bream virus (isolate Blicca bjoerkna L./Germany/DF24/00) TaxID=766180 RepID=NCAP_WBV24|nr:putative nucleocapsid protein [White bream virus]Q008X2.1 RecName: Full=Nucleoprotein; AltName: Full=Nucleocapsid protein; Short=NC; Short=Protein N [White bream virus (strain DF24/00)]ABI97397.1 putative nucleocapsid protein [White bream virus]
MSGMYPQPLMMMPQQQRRPRKPRTKSAPKPPTTSKMSEKTKKEVTKSTMSTEKQIPMPTIPAASKGSLKDLDVRNNLNQQELNGIYYDTVNNLNACHGRMIFQPTGGSLTEGTLTVTIKLRVKSDQCLKMCSAFHKRNTNLETPLSAVDISKESEKSLGKD